MWNSVSLGSNLVVHILEEIFALHYHVNAQTPTGVLE